MGVASDFTKSQFNLRFCRLTSISRDSVAADISQPRFYTQFLTFSHLFVRKSCVWGWKIAILPQFLTFDHHFVRQGCCWGFKRATLHQLSDIYAWCCKIPILHRKACIWSFKVTTLHQFLTLARHFARNCDDAHNQIRIPPTRVRVRHERFPQRVAPAQTKFALGHTFGRPRRTIPAEGHVSSATAWLPLPPKRRNIETWEVGVL
jgi:hypothetical protein